MATGSTELSMAEWATDRYFGERETWGLDAADGRITVQSEVAGEHGSRDSTQPVNGSYSVSVTASMSAVGENDWRPNVPMRSRPTCGHCGRRPQPELPSRLRSEPR